MSEDIATRELELPLEFRAATGSGGVGTLSGYAAVYYNPGDPETEWRVDDRLVERIMPGAFDEILADPKTEVLALSDHDPTRLLGRRSTGTLRLEGRRKGLHFEVDLPNTGEGRDVKELALRGDLRGASMAMKVLDERWRLDVALDLEIREVRKVEIRDVGPTAIPAYKGTSVEARSELEASLERWRAVLYKSSTRQRLARAVEADLDRILADGCDL